MKARLLTWIVILLSSFNFSAFSGPPNGTIVLERSPHQTVRARIEPAFDATGVASYRTNSVYVELGTGLNYQKDGRWIESREIVEPSPDGAVARQGQHQVIFANNLATVGAITLHAPDGKEFRSQVVGLRYHDSASGHSVVLATVKDSTGKIMDGNQVLYADSFSGLLADVRYTYRKGSFEQDIVLREQPPAPELFGMAPEATKLQVITEFLSAPEPERHATEGANDELLFGAMRIGNGRAFALGKDDQRHSIRVTKEWVKQEGRQFLVESAAMADLKQQLEALPKSKSIASSLARAVSDEFVIPRPQLVAASREPMKLAKGKPTTDGLVLDYIMLSGGVSSYTFTNGTTYLITNAFTVSGTATIQGGTVIKYADSEESTSSLYVYQVNCQTSPYRPAILTSMDDNSVGDTIDGSTGSPNPWSGSGYGIYVLGNSVNVNLHNMRISYLDTAIWFQPEYNSTLTLLDSQIYYCGLGLGFTGTTPANLFAGNVLFYMLGGGVYSPRIVNTTLDYITADNVSSLVESDLTGYATLTMSNSIIATVSSVANAGLPVNAGNNGFYNAPPIGNTYFQANSSPFQGVATANHYLLPAGPFSGFGMVSTNSTLASSIRQKTTIAPLLLAGSITANTTLTARGLANTMALDLGYHYDILDYLTSTNTVQNATLTLNGGVAVGVRGIKGFVLGSGAVIDSEGTPTIPNRIDNCRAVLEMTNLSGMPQDSTGAATYPSTMGTQPVPLSATFRFTKFETPAGAYTHMQGGGPGTYVYTDCDFSGGGFHSGYGPGTGPGIGINVTNSLFEQVNISMTGRLPASTRFYNCLFKDGALNFVPQVANSVHLYDNFIDRTTIFEAGQVIDANYNGYINGQARLTPNGGNDKLISTDDFQVGPLGPYYYPTNGGNLSQFIDWGSRTVAAAGLSTYTTQTNQAYDLAAVDTGFHYVGMPNTGSSGVDFWVMFPNNYPSFADYTLALLISGQSATAGTISIPGLNETIPFTIVPGVVTNIVIDNATRIFPFDTITNLGIHVSTGKPVNVTPLIDNFGGGLSEAYLGFPTSMLGTNYCIMSRQSLFGFDPPGQSKFTIVSTADSTVVTITPSPTALLQRFPSGWPFPPATQIGPYSITLNQGDTYQVAGSNLFSDVTGTLVTSTKPIGIVAGDDGARVPSIDINYGNPLYEEQLPVNAWEGWALAMPVALRTNGTLYRVLAAYTNTAVVIQDQLITNLQPGQWFEIVTNGPVEFVGSRPIQVAQISMGADFGGDPGDPFETLLLSPGQYQTNYLFGVTNDCDPNNFVNLIVPQSAISSTVVDGQLLSANVFTAIGSSGYYGAEIQLASGSGTHTASSSQPFGAQVYGMSLTDGYSYNAAVFNPILAAAPDYTNVAPNSTNLIAVLSNDVYSNINTVLVTVIAGPSHGSTLVNGSKQISYATTGYTGTDHFTYQIAENGLVSTAVVTVWIGNHAPVAANDLVCNVGGSPVTINVLANDTDADGDPRTIMFAGPATNGFVTINADQTITYDDGGLPFEVHDSFPYTITDSKGGSSTATVFINPVAAIQDTLFATQYGFTPLDVLANDVDLAGLPLTITAVTQGDHGIVSINPDHKGLTFTPTDYTYTGGDSFSYTISDGICSDTVTDFISIVDLGTSTVSVALGGDPVFYKGNGGTGTYTWFTVTRTQPTFSAINVTLLVGGDGTANQNTDPCNATFPQDFTPSGGSSAPIPNGYMITFPTNQTSVTVFIQATSNPDQCQSGTQAVLVTVPDNGPQSGFTPDPNAFQASAQLKHNF